MKEEEDISKNEENMCEDPMAERSMAWQKKKVKRLRCGKQNPGIQGSMVPEDVAEVGSPDLCRSYRAG